MSLAMAWWEYETPITAGRAREVAFELTGTKPHRATWFRWTSRRGVRGVVLESFYLNGRRLTTIEAMRRFVSRLSNPRTRTEPAAFRQRQIESASARLKALLGSKK